MGRGLDFALGILNGAVGDHLARTGNGLALPMSLARHGRTFPVERAALERACPRPSTRATLLLHGLMCTEDIFLFPDGSGDYGSKLEEEFGLSPLYVRYNTGLAIADNGAALCALLDRLVEEWPAALTEIVPIGYSMGGLLFRAACHAASGGNHAWLPLVKRAFYVGTPHRGAATERAGRVLTRVLGSLPDPVTRLVADVADLRSDGVKDLGDADLRHEDRARRRWTSLLEKEHPVPLLPSIRHHLVAGSVAPDPLLSSLFGDAVVPLGSATDGRVRSLDGRALPPERVRVVAGIGHVGLAHSARVHALLRDWIAEDA